MMMLLMDQLTKYNEKSMLAGTKTWGILAIKKWHFFLHNFVVGIHTPACPF